jgi:hypothetical protein
MTAAEIRDFKVELLDEIHELASDPVADPEDVRQKVEQFFAKLEVAFGEKR